MRLHRRLLSSALLALGAMTLVALMPITASADVAANDVPAALNAAIKAKVEGEGHQYAGLCNGIEQSNNVGKYCGAVISMTDTTADVSYGPVLSEPTARTTFVKTNGAWAASEGIPAELRAAIKSYVEGKGHTYAGLCTEIAQDGSNIGKYCAAVSNVTATQATVTYGPVASNAIATVSFTKVNGGWSATASTTATPRPPATGSGVSADEPGSANTAALAAVAVVLTVSLGVLSARRTR